MLVVCGESAIAFQVGEGVSDQNILLLISDRARLGRSQTKTDSQPSGEAAIVDDEKNHSLGNREEISL